MDCQYKEMSLLKMYNKMRRWRWAAVILLLLSFVSWGIGSQQESYFQNHTPHIVRLHINDMIVDESEYAQNIEDLAYHKNVKAVIVDINSGGGTTTDSQKLYEALRVVALKKPVVTQMDNVAASGGYLVALASDYIIARESTITGSIGVIMQVPEFSGLMKQIGVSINEVRTSELKGEPTPYHPLSAKTQENLQAMVTDSFAWFTGLVKERRPKMTPEQFDVATSGGVFSGKKAVQLGLIDAVGNEKTSLAWLVKNHKIDSSLEIVDIKKPEPPKKFLEEMIFTPFLEQILGISLKNQQKSALQLDGMLCLWQS